MIIDLVMPSLFSTEISHSIPVPQSIAFSIGTLALIIGKTPQKIPLPGWIRKEKVEYIYKYQWACNEYLKIFCPGKYLL
jgi:hypothetical protein